MALLSLPPLGENLAHEANRRADGTKKIDVNKVLVSSPTKRTAWALVVSQCVRQAGLYNSYRQDEAGRGFVLVAPFEPKALPAE